MKFNFLKNKKFWRLTLIPILISLIAYFIFQNNSSVLTEYTVESEKIPKSFDSFRIVQISDLHNAKLFDNNENIFKLITDASPDIIVFTGDLIDSRRTDVKAAVSFVKKAADLAPCYYVTGNHEERVDESFSELLTELQNLDTTVLRGEVAALYRGEETVNILGIDDPAFESGDGNAEKSEIIRNSLSKLSPSESTFNILLSHRPEYFDIYVEENVDLVFSGHAHGGQVRIGSLGLIAPGQGIFPEYDAGIFTKKGCSMIVSRGVGNSIFPLRINNRPEIVVTVLKSKE